MVSAIGAQADCLGSSMSVNVTHTLNMQHGEVSVIHLLAAT
jgi:hypothetical protein